MRMTVTYTAAPDGRSQGVKGTIPERGNVPLWVWLSGMASTAVKRNGTLHVMPFRYGEPLAAIGFDGAVSSSGKGATS